MSHMIAPALAYWNDNSSLKSKWKMKNEKWKMKNEKWKMKNDWLIDWFWNCLEEQWSRKKRERIPRLFMRSKLIQTKKNNSKKVDSNSFHLIFIFIFFILFKKKKSNQMKSNQIKIPQASKWNANKGGDQGKYIVQYPLLILHPGIHEYIFCFLIISFDFIWLFSIWISKTQLIQKEMMMTMMLLLLSMKHLTIYWRFHSFIHSILNYCHEKNKKWKWKMKMKMIMRLRFNKQTKSKLKATSAQSIWWGAQEIRGH